MRGSDREDCEPGHRADTDPDGCKAVQKSCLKTKIGFAGNSR